MRDFDRVARDVQTVVSVASSKYRVTPIHEHDGSIIHFPVSPDAVVTQADLKQVCKLFTVIGTVYKAQIDFSRSQLNVCVIFSGTVPEVKQSKTRYASVDLPGVDASDAADLREAIEHVFRSSNDGVLPSIYLESEDEYYNVCATGLRVVNHPMHSTFEDLQYDFEKSETRARVQRTEHDRPCKRQRRN